MRRDELIDGLAIALEGRRLLSHPFYQRWSRGEMTRDELRSYAGEYRHFEAALPGLLTQIADAAPTAAARDGVLRNLKDEVGGTVSHLWLFDRFCAELAAPVDAVPGPAMAALLETYADAAGQGAATGMAAILAYEAQAPDVADTKALGLREHFAMSDQAVEFWDVHGTVDRDHAEWAVTTVADMSGDAVAVGKAMRAAADAWWAFLDEREAAAVPGASGAPC